MDKFRRGDAIVVNNDKLKTNGCTGVVLGRHYIDDRWGDIESSSCDVKIDCNGRELVTYIKESNLELIEK